MPGGGRTLAGGVDFWGVSLGHQNIQGIFHAVLNLQNYTSASFERYRGVFTHAKLAIGSISRELRRGTRADSRTSTKGSDTGP